MKKESFIKIFSYLLFFILSVSSVLASELTSTSFKIRDPVIGTGGGYSSSGSFTFFGAGNLNLSGFNSSTGFFGAYGFLYFPFLTSGVLATPSVTTTTINLSWTASTAGRGFNVSGYQVGKATVSGGPYTYTTVGNVVATSYTSQTVGTYYFVFQTLDGLGVVAATSNEVSATVASSPPPPSSGSSGGAPPPYVAPATSVTFSGRAYPSSTVTLLKDAQVATTTIAGSDATFTINLSGLSGGNYIFSIYSEDNKGSRSSLLTFPVSITIGVTTNIGGIFIAPTIAVDKSEVKRGENIAIFGQSTPASEITISVNSEQEFFIKKSSDKDGIYLLNFDTSVLEMGGHSTKSKTALNGAISSFSKVIAFKVGTKTVYADNTVKILKSDLNADSRVNLVDFSIAAFWYKRPLSETFKLVEKEKLNGDGKVDLVDLSILAFYWTG